jgi:DNA modification methylase
MITQTILQGDCRQILTTLADNSVHCIVTSPPYWNQRDYGVVGQIGSRSYPGPVCTGYGRSLPGSTASATARRYALVKPGRYLLQWAGSRTTQVPQTKDKGDMRDVPSNRRAQGFSKQLIGIPWRVAFALQDDGWILRQDIIWHKRNPMPESVTDRPTKAHEYIFLFSKSGKYYYDAEAIKEPVSGGAHSRGKGQNPKRVNANEFVRAGESFDTPYLVDTKNKRTVWTIANQAYSGTHYATFPEKLIEPCILTTPQQVCEHCGAGWIRVVEKSEPVKTGKGGSRKATELTVERRGESSTRTSCFATGTLRQTKTVGWRPGCKCEGNTGSDRATMLDPFGGSGTVGQVATRFNRNSILVELNPEYIGQIEKRTDEVQIQMAI